jgi:hypothetical protein
VSVVFDEIGIFVHLAQTAQIEIGIDISPITFILASYCIVPMLVPQHVLQPPHRPLHSTLLRVTPLLHLLNRRQNSPTISDVSLAISHLNILSLVEILFLFDFFLEMAVDYSAELSAIPGWFAVLGGYVLGYGALFDVGRLVGLGFYRSAVRH